MFHIVFIITYACFISNIGVSCTESENSAPSSILQKIGNKITKKISRLSVKPDTQTTDPQQNLQSQEKQTEEFLVLNVINNYSHIIAKGVQESINYNDIICDQITNNLQESVFKFSVHQSKKDKKSKNENENKQRLIKKLQKNVYHERTNDLTNQAQKNSFNVVNDQQTNKYEVKAIKLCKSINKQFECIYDIKNKELFIPGDFEESKENADYKYAIFNSRISQIVVIGKSYINKKPNKIVYDDLIDIFQNKIFNNYDIISKFKFDEIKSILKILFIMKLPKNYVLGIKKNDIEELENVLEQITKKEFCNETNVSETTANLKKKVKEVFKNIRNNEKNHGLKKQLDSIDFINMFVEGQTSKNSIKIAFSKYISEQFSVLFAIFKYCAINNVPFDMITQDNFKNDIEQIKKASVETDKKTEVTIDDADKKKQNVGVLEVIQEEDLSYFDNGEDNNEVSNNSFGSNMIKRVKVGADDSTEKITKDGIASGENDKNKSKKKDATDQDYVVHTEIVSNEEIDKITSKLLFNIKGVLCQHIEKLKGKNHIKTSEDIKSIAEKLSKSLALQSQSESFFETIKNYIKTKQNLLNEKYKKCEQNIMRQMQTKSKKVQYGHDKINEKYERIKKNRSRYNSCLFQ